MTAFVFANYVDTTLAAAASSTATSLSLSSSTNLPTLGPGEIMPMTLNDAATGQVYEIVYVTAISGTTLTVLRGQEGTAAQNWSSGDYAFVSPTADTVAPVAGTHSPVASETLPAVNHLVVTPGTLTAAIDLTLNDQAVAGSSVTVFGSASDYTVTVQSPVTTGSPYIELPDSSQVYSWAIPASSPSQGIELVWDGANWRARTFGQEVVAPATQNNAAVQLGQVSQVAPVQTTVEVSAPAASTLYQAAVSFTAPCAGYVIAIAVTNMSNAADAVEVQSFINGVAGQSSSTGTGQTEIAFFTATAGQAITCDNNTTTGSTAPGVSMSVQISAFFVPAP